MTDLRTRGRDTRDSILESARNELTRRGILGLRVADVAEGANTSVTSIYRLFGDRHGLLAQILGDIMEDIVQSTVEQFRLNLEGRYGLSLEDLVSALPFQFAFRDLNNKFRLQILAAATENEALERRLREVISRRHDMWREILAEVQTRMAPGQNFDSRVFFGLLFDLMPYASSHLGDRRMSHDDFVALLVDKLRVDPPR